MEICNGDRCTGCYACFNICPKNAIEMKNDCLSTEKAVINSDKCINCGACKTVCPENNVPKLNKILKCYAAWSKQEKYQKECASGGIATGFSEAIIKSGGAVFGTRFSGFELIFDFAETVAEAEKFKGSKYVRANVGDCFKKVRDVLLEDRQVLFVGTPCQVGGLKNYLGKTYEKLITIDLICHGTPPQEYLKEHILSITNMKIKGVSFRGDKDFFLTVTGDDDKVIYSKKSDEDTYFRAFLDGMIFRENCYSCTYACSERVGDITIGDFWGLDKNSLKRKHNGRISVVLVNGENGKRFFEKCKDLFEYEERPIEEAIKGNGQLNAPSTKYCDRDNFVKAYKPGNFETAVRTEHLLKEIKQYKKSKSFRKRAINKLKKIFLYNS